MTMMNQNVSICFNSSVFRFPISWDAAEPGGCNFLKLQFFCFRFFFRIDIGFRPIICYEVELQFFCFRFRRIRRTPKGTMIASQKLQFFCFRFAVGSDKKNAMFLLESFNSSVLDSEPWFYLPLFKFFPALFTGSRQRVIPVFDARFVIPLTVSRLRYMKNSDGQFNPAKTRSL